MNEPWTIQLFGALRVRQGERGITRFRTQQTGALLAYLAYHRHQSHSREALVELFWPESELETGRHNLSNALSSLRNLLEPPGVSGGAVIIADRFSVGLNPDAVTTDVAAFEQALRRAAQGRMAADYGDLVAAAADCCLGPLLPHYYDEWIVPERERLQQRFQQNVSQLVTLLEKTGDFQRALEYAQRSLATDRLREEAHRDVMRLLAASGQPEEALRQYRELTRLLAEELGEEPAPASRELAREMAARLQAPAAEGATRTPPGRSPSPTQSLTPSPLPTGTVSFLLSDVEGSTVLREQAGEAFRSALATHHALLRAEFRRKGGHEIKEGGDSFIVAFAGASDSLACAIACQKALAAHPWPDSVGRLRVRMALHTGDVELEDGEYRGPMLHRTARMLAAANGGQTLVSEQTAALLRHDTSPGVHLTDLGMWRLRDLELPERLFQVEWPQMEPREFPPLNAAPAHTARLPLQFTRFFGRQAEIEAIARLLCPHAAGSTPAAPHVEDPVALSPRVNTSTHPHPETAAPRAKPEGLRLSGAGTHTPTHPDPPRTPSRLLTLTGPGGSGKTRLAIAAAERVAETFQGGIWFVPLADLSDPRLIAGAILDAIGIPRAGQMEPLEQVVAALSKQSSLLILDNFEQLVDGGVEIVQTLLERVPGLGLLVTSRQILNLPAEQEFPVSPLPTPNGPDSPERLGTFESVQLFVDRAQAAKPDFRVTSGNAAAVAELCDRLEGLPLAIELAAARALVLTPAQMLAQLGRRFEFLGTRKRGVAERHRTLRAAVDWSYKLLSPELQGFFARLSVFRGGWTVEAAESVCEEPLALDLLAQLRECSLILTDRSEHGIRFRMLETLREYAWEQLEREEQAAVRERHLDLFVALVEQGEQQLGGPEAPVWLNRFGAEHDNLRAALECCRASEDGAERCLRLAGSLGEFCFLRGHWSEGRAHIGSALSLGGAQQRTKARVNALNWAGILAGWQGDHDLGRLLIEESLAIKRELGDQRGVAGSLHNLGVVACDVGDYAAARSLIEEALKINRDLSNREWESKNLNSMAVIALREGDYHSARVYYQDSIVISRERGDGETLLRSLHDLGIVARCLADYPAARSAFEESLATARGLGHREIIAAALGNLGNVGIDVGDYPAARAHCEAALEEARSLGYPSLEANNLANLGEIAYRHHDYASARSLWEQALAIRRDMGRRDIAGSLRDLAIMDIDRREHGAARSLVADGLAIALQSGEKAEIPALLEVSASLAAAQGEPQRAVRLWGAAHGLQEALSAPPLRYCRDRESVEREQVAARAALGEEAFEAAWASGYAMTWEVAVAYALEGSTQEDRGPDSGNL